MIDMLLSKALVNSYIVVHGFLHLRGAGFPIRRCVRFLKGLQSYPLRLPDGHWIQVDFRDVSATYWLNFLLGDRFEEEGLFKAIAEIVHSESIIWDCGANCGLFSYRLLKLEMAKQIVFFEPNPLMFALASSATKPFPKAMGINIALSDRSGKAIMHIPNGTSTTASIDNIHKDNEACTIEVGTRTGDDLVNSGGIGFPDIIKIDTEGHEMSVIKGLMHVIEIHTPYVFFENISVSDFDITNNKPDGYDIYTVNDDTGKLVKGIDRSAGHNCAYVPLSHFSYIPK